MSDFEEYISDDENEFDDSSEDDVDENDEEQNDEDDHDELNNDVITSSVKKKILNNGFYDFDKEELDKIKLDFLKKPGRFEIIGILETLIDLYKSGSYSLIDESKLNIQLYDNYNIINEETAAFIALKEKSTGVCVLKENKIINVDNYEDIYIDHFIKYILRIHDNNNTVIRIDTLKQIYRDLDIYHDDIYKFSCKINKN